MKQAQIDGLLADHEKYHSAFQIENFIVGHGHAWGRYKQALREIEARRTALEEIADEIEAAEIEQGAGGFAIFARARKVKAIKARRTARKLSALKERRTETQRELAEFVQIAVNLKRQIGELTIAKRRELEAEMWLDKARRMAALDLLTVGGLQRQTAEFITSLPRDQRRRVFVELAPEHRQKLLSILD